MKELHFLAEYVVSVATHETGNKTLNSSFVDITAQQLDALIERVKDAKENNLSLDPGDTQLLLDALLTLMHLQEKLAESDITLHKLRKLLGMVKSTEKLAKLVGQQNEKSSQAPPPAREQTKPNKSVKKISTKKITPQVVHHQLVTIKKGDPCPECARGTFCKAPPGSLLRVSGQSPLRVEQHVIEKLRCSGCGAYVSAPLPEAVKQDGNEQQKYGFSARSVMAMQRYFGGSPFFRQESLLSILGIAICASTIYDQCELLANDLQPIVNALQLLAANAWQFYLDDTTNRILNQRPILKKDRHSGKERLRSGIYTSGLIATTVEGHRIALFKTNIGHAGEWLDEVLTHRHSEHPPPLLMCDALSRNNPTVTPVHLTLCNAHARRQFVDVLAHFALQVEQVLTWYQGIWVNDKETQAQAMTASQRLAYHQTHSLPIMDRIKHWGQEQLAQGSVEENSGLGKAINYFIKHFVGLTGFCRHEGAMLDNNIMEGQLKLIIRGRKNSLFYKTLAGAAVGDVITSVIATTAGTQANVFDYLTAVQQHRERVKAQPMSWMPWNYHEQLLV